MAQVKWRAASHPDSDEQAPPTMWESGEYIPKDLQKPQTSPTTSHAGRQAIKYGDQATAKVAGKGYELMAALTGAAKSTSPKKPAGKTAKPGSMKKGGVVKKSGVAKIHKGEIVVSGAANGLGKGQKKSKPRKKRP